jgi:hypothetical protein
MIELSILATDCTKDKTQPSVAGFYCRTARSFVIVPVGGFAISEQNAIHFANDVLVFDSVQDVGEML